MVFLTDTRNKASPISTFSYRENKNVDSDNGEMQQYNIGDRIIENNSHESDNDNMNSIGRSRESPNDQAVSQIIDDCHIDDDQDFKLVYVIDDPISKSNQTTKLSESNDKIIFNFNF